jgi:hypothetical protein
MSSEPEQVEIPEVVQMTGAADEQPVEAVTQPARVMRIGSMIKQLLEEVRSAPLDERSRDRLAEIFDISVNDLADALSPDLADELRRLAPPFGDGVPSDSELRIAQAQLVGWLEGLFHGIQATLFAQQVVCTSSNEAGSPVGRPRNPTVRSDDSRVICPPVRRKRSQTVKRGARKVVGPAATHSRVTHQFDSSARIST